MKILLSGAGFIGTQLFGHLTTIGHDVSIVRRGGRGGYDYYPDKGVANPRQLEGVDAVICLNGVPIFRPWTARGKEEILRSRLTSVRTWVDTFERMENPPTHFISGSATGFYGVRGEEILTEESGPGTGFLSEVCQRWEAQGERATALGINHTALRTGLVIGHGGLMGILGPLFRSGLGGNLGRGDQWMSPIGMTDYVRAVGFILDHHLTGPVNMTGPAPLRNKELTRVLGEAYSAPTWAHVPQPVLTLGGEMVTSLVGSQRVIPQALINHGFTFDYPDFASMLGEVVE